MAAKTYKTVSAKKKVEDNPTKSSENVDSNENTIKDIDICGELISYDVSIQMNISTK